MNKFEIVKSGNQKYPYNARILTSVDGGENYYYCGNGRYFKTPQEAFEFIKSKAVEELKGEIEDDVFPGVDEDYVPAGVYISPIRSEYRAKDETSFGAMEVNVPGGVLRATKSLDPEYPGIDIEFIATAEDRSCGKFLSRPRVLMEYKIEDNELRAAVWADEKSEDYSDDIEFNKHYYK